MYIKYSKNVNLEKSATYNYNKYYESNSSNNSSNNSEYSGLIPRIGNAFSNETGDVLLNPYSAPLRDDRIYNGEYGGPKKFQ